MEKKKKGTEGRTKKQNETAKLKAIANFHAKKEQARTNREKRKKETKKKFRKVKGTKSEKLFDYFNIFNDCSPTKSTTLKDVVLQLIYQRIKNPIRFLTLIWQQKRKNRHLFKKFIL